MTRGQPFGSLEGHAPPVAVTKELLEEIGKEILALYVTRSNGGFHIGDLFLCSFFVHRVLLAGSKRKTGEGKRQKIEEDKRKTSCTRV